MKLTLIDFLEKLCARNNGKDGHKVRIIVCDGKKITAIGYKKEAFENAPFVPGELYVRIDVHQRLAENTYAEKSMNCYYGQLLQEQTYEQLETIAVLDLLAIGLAGSIKGSLQNDLADLPE